MKHGTIGSGRDIETTHGNCMLLATHIIAALKAEISGHLARSGNFPLDVRTSSFSFQVSPNPIDGNLLLAVLTVEGQDFRVYQANKS